MLFHKDRILHLNKNLLKVQESGVWLLTCSLTSHFNLSPYLRAIKKKTTQTMIVTTALPAPG